MNKRKMKSILVACSINIKQAMQCLNDSAEGILFVVDEKNKLLGTITDGDIRRGLIRGIEFTAGIEEIMQRNNISLSCVSAEVEEQARRIMAEKKIEQIPVLDKKGRVVDVVLWTDIIKDKQKDEAKSLSNSVVIMAGGKGTRLDPFTKILPKPLIPIGEKPIIEIIMGEYYKAGFHKFIYTLNYKKEYIKLFLREGIYPYIIDFVEEEAFLGTAGALSLLKDKVDDTFFVANCDTLLDIDYRDLLQWHKEHKADMTIVGCHNEVKIPYGVLEMSGGKVLKIKEKPSHDVVINTGVYVMEPGVLPYIPVAKYFDMNQLMETMIREKKKISVYTITSGWFDIGQWDEYKKSVEHFKGFSSE